MLLKVSSIDFRRVDTDSFSGKKVSFWTESGRGFLEKGRSLKRKAPLCSGSHIYLLYQFSLGSEHCFKILMPSPSQYPQRTPLKRQEISRDIEDTVNLLADSISEFKGSSEDNPINNSPTLFKEISKYSMELSRLLTSFPTLSSSNYTIGVILDNVQLIPGISGVDRSLFLLLPIFSRICFNWLTCFHKTVCEVDFLLWKLSTRSLETLNVG